MSQPDAEDLDARIAHLEQRDQRLSQALELLAQRAPAPAKTGRDWDAYAAVIASFIGLLALGVSGYTAHVQRQQLRAQVWPHLEILYSARDTRFQVSNAGTGPARITAMRVTVNATAIRNWTELENAAGFAHGDRPGYSSLSDAVLPAGKDYVFLQPRDSEPSQITFRELLPGGKHPITVTLCYCSVLDDCWTAVGGSGPGISKSRSAECPITADERFRD